MKIEVDWDLCESNGVCMGIIPEVFNWKTTTCWLLQPEVTPENEALVREASVNARTSRAGAGLAALPSLAAGADRTRESRVTTVATGHLGAAATATPPSAIADEAGGGALTAVSPTSRPPGAAGATIPEQHPVGAPSPPFPPSAPAAQLTATPPIPPAPHSTPPPCRRSQCGGELRSQKPEMMTALQSAAACRSFAALW